jgi:hypothetical protein
MVLLQTLKRWWTRLLSRLHSCWQSAVSFLSSIWSSVSGKITSLGVLTPNPQPVGLLSTAVNAALPGLGLIKIGIVVAAIGGLYYTVWSRGYDRCETQHAAANARVHKKEAALEIEDAATFAREREIGEKLARDFAAASNLQKHVLDSSTAAALNKNGGAK